MAVQFDLQKETGKPVIYVVGTRMLEDQLQALATQLDTALNEVIVAYIDDESGPGSELAETLDIEIGRLPALLVLEDDDSVYRDWYGQEMPSVEQVVYEVSQLTGGSGA